MTDVFMIAGPAGSGKSTLGVALAEHWGVPFLDLDHATSALVAAFRFDHPQLTEAQALTAAREARYAELARQARTIVATDQPSALVLIAPFTAEVASPGRWGEWVEGISVEAHRAHLVWLALPPGERLARMAVRGATRDTVLVEGAKGGWGLPVPPEPAVGGLIVDALLPTAAEIDLVVQRFGNGPFVV